MERSEALKNLNYLKENCSCLEVAVRRNTLINGLMGKDEKMKNIYKESARFLCPDIPAYEEPPFLGETEPEGWSITKLLGIIRKFITDFLSKLIKTISSFADYRIRIRLIDIVIIVWLIFITLYLLSSK